MRRGFNVYNMVKKLGVKVANLNKELAMINIVMTNRKILEQKLAGIKELKTQWYIGTKEAKAYLDAYERIHREPQEIANWINAQLPENAPYKATPERVVAAYNAVITFLIPWWEGWVAENREKTSEEDYEPNSLFEKAWVLYHQNRPEEQQEQWEGLESGPKGLRGGKNIILNIFANQNTLGPCDDGDARMLVASPLPIAEDFKKDLAKKINDSELAEECARELHHLYLERILDPECGYRIDFTSAFRRWQELERTEVDENYIYGEMILERITNDRVDHRLEYQRQIAILMARGAKNSDEVLEKLKEKIQKQDLRIEELPEPMTRLAMSIAKKLRMYYQIVARNRAFLDKYLQS